MVMISKKIILLSILLIGIATIPPVSALKLLAVNDDNTMFQTATHIPDPFNNSYFTLETFEREGQSHWYSFVGEKGMVITIKTLVPDLPVSRDFMPSFDLIIGVDKVTPDTQRTRFHQELTNTDWFITAELKMTLPSDGLYYIRAHDELDHFTFGDTGKFSMVVGEVDNLSFFDWLQVPFWILHVNLFFENLVFVWIMLTLLLIVAVIVLYMIVRRRERN